MIRTLAILGLLVPSALAAQARPDSLPPRWAAPTRGLLFGVTAFTQGQWQPSGLELGLTHASAGSSRSVYAMIRLGSFSQDQAVLLSQTQGFFTAMLVGVRMPLATLAEVGAEGEPSQYLRLLGVLEAGPELNVNSPLPQGNAMGVVSPLVGIGFGGGAGLAQDFAILVGPSWFIGRTTTVHVQVTLRYQMPLGVPGGGRRRGRR